MQFLITGNTSDPDKATRMASLVMSLQRRGIAHSIEPDFAGFLHDKAGLPIDQDLRWVGAGNPYALSEETDAQSISSEDTLSSNSKEATIDIEQDRKDTEDQRTSSSYSHSCEVSDCTKPGTESYLGLSGNTEWYCQEHYDEMISMVDDMEDVVGFEIDNSHSCEVCSRAGTHSIVGISGQLEYYCTEHYNEMQDMLELFTGY